MSRLRAEPAITVETAGDLHALDRGLSGQAIRLYGDLASRMAEFGNDGARAAFERIGALQRENAPGDATAPAPTLPEVFQDEGLRDLRLVTPYRAFALAVRNEERAFAFWSYLSAHARDPAVKNEAERLALAEMDHVGVLRAERRAAYKESREPSFDYLRTASLAELEAEAARREAALAGLHVRIAAVLADAEDPLAHVLDEIAQEERDTAGELGATDDMVAPSDALPTGRASLRALAVERLEITVEVYLFVADQSGHEEVVATAQDLATRGLERLARLR
ncbi:hypothetical protein [Citreimonas salinaria]|uniref:Rubrerythrin n=1 Tax=Citreimonas salinaria TaxID=321339 RepID=A0A1H3NBU8_9RHOB|nr:hypothetical protein [Citreimonas salinaria]SDY86213.1 hypothetical protein SAMN05444340_12237 [Citreimonas salinaria]